VYLILYLHGRTSIWDELRYHVNHLHEFIVYIRGLNLTFSHPAQPSSLSPLPSRHSTLKQHSSSILSSPSFKHLYVNKPTTRIGSPEMPQCGLVVDLGCTLGRDRKTESSSDVGNLTAARHAIFVAATYVRSRSSVG
jgi:hypothetical protein